MVKANKHKFQSFYTDSSDIVECMAEMLNVQPEDSVLEPCAGEGVFVEALLKKTPGLNLTLYEINTEATAILKSKFGDIPTISINNSDTLLSSDIILKKKKYDKIIGNPPYGLRFTDDQRNKIRKIYSSVYNKESYVLFLYSCLRLLEKGGVLCFIVPDTFLSLNRFEPFRKSLMSEYCIQEILLFPSRFFPGISFGYSNLCIISIQKPYAISQVDENMISIYQGFKDVKDLKTRNCSEIISILQRDVVSGANSSLCFKSNGFIKEILNFGFATLGDYADCVTGFYSGCDREYLKSFVDTPKSTKYGKISKSEVYGKELTSDQKKYGIAGDNCFVPIVKGGNVRYHKGDVWFMDWSAKAIREYRESKKCRFQNEQYYFSGNGIGVPMVRSKNITAALIGNRLFDQSIVGIFPKDASLKYYILAYLNSEICSELVNSINPTTNNSANYLKRVPFVRPSQKDIAYVNEKVKIILDKIARSQTYIGEQEDLDAFFRKQFQTEIEDVEHRDLNGGDFDLGGLFSCVV